MNSESWPPRGADSKRCAGQVGGVSSLGVEIRDVINGELLYALPEERGSIWGLAWHPDSRRLAVSRGQRRYCSLESGGSRGAVGKTRPEALKALVALWKEKSVPHNEPS